MQFTLHRGPTVQTEMSLASAEIHCTICHSLSGAKQDCSIVGLAALNAVSPKVLYVHVTTHVRHVCMCVCSAGIRSCSVGGIVVYSTCSLSPVQNDGVVAATLEHIWHHTGIEVVIEDIRTSMKCFAPMFKFFDGCRYGNLVLPNLVSNFGPMYFCRIRRIS